MQKASKYKFLVFVIACLLLAFFVLPNIFNSRETKAFGNESRLDFAKRNYHIKSAPDSVELIPGEFYRRGPLIKFLLGSAYRELWQQKLKVPLLDLKELGLTPFAFSGSMQTIGIRCRDSLGQVWSIRSVNKDQIAALPPVLHYSLLRPMFRDQACSLNPYGALPLIKLAPAVEIHCDTPRLFLFPYDPSLGKYNNRMAGRLIALTKARETFLLPGSSDSTRVLSSAEMIESVKNGNAVVDTALYLRSRLFDMLISDWDRHPGNWKWLERRKGGKTVLEPLATDRDMAFYKFGDGIINKITLLFVDTFQSFEPEYDNVSGLVKQADELDKMILTRVAQEHFLSQARFIQSRLGDSIITASFRLYPQNAYALAGKKHQVILKERLEKLPDAAKQFFSQLQDADK